MVVRKEGAARGVVTVILVFNNPKLKLEALNQKPYSLRPGKIGFRVNAQ